MRLLKWSFWAVVVVVFPFAALTASTVFFGSGTPNPAPADYIVVVSGPGPETAERTAFGAELFRTVEGARALVLSGGTGAAEDMKAQAVAAGVDPQAIITENASRSTLQNALFVRDIWNDLGLDPEDRLLVVTHLYHANRTLQSFRWAGFDDIAVQPVDGENPKRFSRHVAAEAIKWPLNILRAAFASAMMEFDVPRGDWIELLN